MRWLQEYPNFNDNVAQYVNANDKAGVFATTFIPMHKRMTIHALVKYLQHQQKLVLSQFSSLQVTSRESWIQ